MASVYQLNLDLHTTQSNYALPITAGDTDRELWISFSDGGRPVSLEGVTATMTINWTPPELSEGTPFGQSDILDIRDGSYAVASLDKFQCNYPGEYLCEIDLAKGGKNVASPKFTLSAAHRLKSYGGNVPGSEINNFITLIAQTNEAKEAAKSAAGFANVAASYANDAGGKAITAADAAKTAKDEIERAAAEGRFDGEKGKDGTSITIEDSHISNEAGGTSTLTFSNGTVVSIRNGLDGEDGTDGKDGLDGQSVTHSWDGTKLTISSASGSSTVDLKGEPGAKGDGFTIAKTYPSIKDMIADYNNDKVRINDLVLINTGNVEDEDNAKLFIKRADGFSYLTDLSGSEGIKGDPGAKGDDGLGIASISKTDTNGLVDTYTITYTNGATSSFTVTNGAKGKDGISVGIASIDENKGTHTITFTDGKTLSVKNGVGIASVVRVAEEPLRSTYCITFTDETTTYFDVRHGANGEDGTSVSVVDVKPSTEDGGENKVIFSDGTELVVRNGSKGTKGDPGKDGTDGIDGTDGTDGKNAYEYAQDGGYQGTEEEFAAKLASGYPVLSVNGHYGNVKLNAEDVGARPDTWTPTASEVGARPDDWMPTATDVGARPDDWMPTASDVGARPVDWVPTYSQVGAEKSGTVSAHNTNESAHSDIRSDITSIKNRLNAVLDSDDSTLDELHEIVSFIKENREDITEITDSKVNKADIVNNLTSNDANKVLSAAQGKALKTEIDGKADRTEGVYFIKGASGTAGTWTGTHPDITAYYDGLMIAYKIGVAGASTTTLNINGLGAVKVVKNASSAISTNFAVNSVIFLVYTVDGSTAYWKAHDYDANTRNSVGDYQKNNTKLYFVGTTTTDDATSSSYATSYTNSKVYVDANNVFNAESGFKGNLTGNADSATKAVQDGNGNNIANTYETKEDATRKFSEIGVAPDYIVAEAERVAKKVISHQNENTFSFIACSDIHFSLVNANATTMLDSLNCLRQGMQLVSKKCHIDFGANLGDAVWDGADETVDNILDAFRVVNESLYPTRIGLPLWFNPEGNHDSHYNGSTKLTRGQTYANTGAFNDNATAYYEDDKSLGVCYRDVDRYKLRILVTNGNDYSAGQKSFITTALSTAKEKDYKVLILTHQPPDEGGANGVHMTAITSNDNVLAVMNGHGHSFKVRNLGTSTIKGITTMIASPYRRNESATYGTELGNLYGDFDASGKAIKYKEPSQTLGTAEATSFCVYTYDAKTQIMYADSFGLGLGEYDREIDCNTAQVVIINQVTISTAMDSDNVYNNGLGYKNSYRLSSSSPFESGGATGYTLTGYMPFNYISTEPIYIKGAEWVSGDSNCRMYLFNDKATLSAFLIAATTTANNQNNINTMYTVETLGDAYIKLTPKSNLSTPTNFVYYNGGNVRYFRISLKGSGDNLVISLGQPIE